MEAFRAPQSRLSSGPTLCVSISTVTEVELFWEGFGEASLGGRVRILGWSFELFGDGVPPPLWGSYATNRPHEVPPSTDIFLPKHTSPTYTYSMETSRAFKIQKQAVRHTDESLYHGDYYAPCLLTAPGLPTFLTGIRLLSPLRLPRRASSGPITLLSWRF